MELLFFKIAITIFLLSTIQSLMGIGLLIVGTPLFLSYNFNFFETLEILLPCSLTVSFYQLLVNKNSKEKSNTHIVRSHQTNAMIQVDEVSP